MNQKSTLNEINNNVRILIQLQDLSTIQTALLAIIFGLFVFSATAILSRYNDLVYVFSFIMIFIELIALLFLLSSIFASSYETKVESFRFVAWFLVFVLVYILVSLLYFGLSLKLTSNFSVNNIGIVSFFIIILPLFFVIDKFIDKKIKKRFNLLYIKEKPKSLEYKILNRLDEFLYKNIRKLSLSFLIAIFISILTGLVETTTLHYGFPFSWFIQGKNGKSFTIDSSGLYLDFIIFTIATYVVIYVVKYFRIKKKNSIKNIPGFTPYKKP